MTEVLTYEALKAERDALAVENAALKSKAAELVHEASEVYSAYNATIKEPDGDFMDMQTMHEMKCIETPATDAALAAIQALGVEKAIERLMNMFASTGHIGIPVMALEGLAKELREAK
ncbi:Uncharacterised protein [Serratia marcescens]|uniref:hypothetical protein n=1 Tax=Serratia marcescens TaxID=615 RepID=UPI000744ED34|nr:hypothetical protein [Serratia marcescens]CUZ82596.1 Uncharacterised protein [Serratia marcescens]CVA50711.1 Uncharacterised protein [Serratia marcescens]CVA77091.1 Uncharacterised protein [Serratia marcescens]CVH12758.1 Uncharacterised protein [Serratia marcescens]